MEVLLHGKEAKNIKDLIKSLGFEIVTANPDVIISFGGDGTLLTSERLYPGIPKLPVRNSLICKKCDAHKEEVVLQELLEGKLNLVQHKKLETTILYKNLYALNDFVIRNSDPTHSIRFRTSKSNDKLLIGDGIVVATPFGSSGYFKSITQKIFESGFGLAFNNTTEKIAPLILTEQDNVTFKLIRGKATLSFDNNPDIFMVDEGSEIIFKLSNQVAKIYSADSLRCPNCQVIRS